jgi:deferrochelatase/peroxidase EfeB
MTILAADNPADATAAEPEIRQHLDGIAKIYNVETGLTLRQELEATACGTGLQKEVRNVVVHSGYANSDSQPAFLQRQLEESTSMYWQHPSVPLELMLTESPHGTKNFNFGSFLGSQKLELNIQGFKKAEAKHTEALGLPKELGGAMAVGRYEDGTPLALQLSDGGLAKSHKQTIPNDFDDADDPECLEGPLHAHVRKCNPRLESLGSFAAIDELELGRRIARRGLTYGESLSGSDDLGSLPEKGAGLLFLVACPVSGNSWSSSSGSGAFTQVVRNQGNPIAPRHQPMLTMKNRT